MKQLTRVLSGFLLANLLVVLVMGIQPVSQARAAPTTYTVNFIGDPGDGTCDTGSCTLRDAITAANANVGADTINFSVSGTITLTLALPIINEDLIIDGSGNTVVINGNNTYQILVINSGVTVSLNALTIQNGKSDLTGGGIFNNGTLTVNNSTFSGNQAVAGGGIYNSNSLTITNSTFSGNGATASGGGIYNEAGALTITNSTFSGNSATTSGGGIYNKTGATLNYANTIVANSVTGGDCGNAGTVGVNNHNLVEDNTCFATLIGDPKLEALADNGGPTLTFKLLAGSPAINAGDNAICAAPPVSNLDQRGVARPLGPYCDIGAYEAVFVPVVSLSPSALNFGDQVVGTTSAAKDVVLTYTGSESITLGALGISGEFALASNTCDNATLGPSEQCSFSVTFSPASDGAKTGSVTISDNVPSTLASLPLTGTGTSPAVGLSATSLTFASQFVGTTSAARTVTLTNTGTGNLKIGIVRTGSEFTLRTNTCNGVTLAAAGTCKFGVAFSPISAGTKTSSVIISSNASTSPNRVALRGTVKAGTQLLKMANFDTTVQPIPWVVSTPRSDLVSLRTCSVFLSPSCSAKFTGTARNSTLSAVQIVYTTGAAGNVFYIGMASRASKVPGGGQYSVLVSFYNRNSKVGSKTFSFSNGSHDFQTLGVYYTVPAAYNRILFNFTYQKTGGIVWLDNAVLIKIP